MNAKRMSELDEHPEQATAGELTMAWATCLGLVILVIGVIACLVARIAQEVQ